MSDRGTISVSVVTEIAEREGVDPTELTPPLFDVVDPAALDELFRPTGAGASASCVQFDYKGYTVVADSTGTVRVRTAGGPSGSAATD